MICDSCKIEVLVTDFINNQKFCYRCMYREKIEKSSKKRMKIPLFCRVCEQQIIHKENLKKRQRTAFCSLECAKKAHKEQIKNYWCRTVSKKYQKSAKLKRMKDGFKIVY